MKTKLVSARLPEEDTATIEEMAKMEKTGKTTALRKIIALGAKQYRLENAVKSYAEGKASLGKASEMAKESVWEFADELKRRNILNHLVAEEDFAEGLQNVQKARKK